MLPLLRKRRLILLSLTFAIFYLLFAIYMMNYPLVFATLLGNFTLQYKFNVLFFLLLGAPSAMDRNSLLLTTFIGLLTGLNLALILPQINSLKKMQGRALLFGSGSLLGVAGGGCAACGLSLFSLLGIGGSLLYLPMRGFELTFISLALLLFSLFYNYGSIKKTDICKTKIK